MKTSSKLPKRSNAVSGQKAHKKYPPDELGQAA